MRGSSTQRGVEQKTQSSTKTTSQKKTQKLKEINYFQPRAMLAEKKIPIVQFSKISHYPIFGHFSCCFFQGWTLAAVGRGGPAWDNFYVKTWAARV